MALRFNFSIIHNKQTAYLQLNHKQHFWYHFQNRFTSCPETMNKTNLDFPNLDDPASVKK